MRFAGDRTIADDDSKGHNAEEKVRAAVGGVPLTALARVAAAHLSPNANPLSTPASITTTAMPMIHGMSRRSRGVISRSFPQMIKQGRPGSLTARA